MTETPAEREARLLAIARDEVLVEARHNFQEAITANPVASESVPGLFARALFRLGFQSKLSGFDGVTVEKMSNQENG